MEVQAVQVLVRVIYKDGTIGLITVAPMEVPHDALDDCRLEAAILRAILARPRG